MLLLLLLLLSQNFDNAGEPNLGGTSWTPSTPPPPPPTTRTGASQLVVDWELYQKLLFASEEERAIELMKFHRMVAELKRREGGHFNAEWCRRSSIRPGVAGCS